MEKYMIGDEFGNMWNDKSEDFFCDRGTIYNSKDFAEKIMTEVSNKEEYSKRDWEFKLWTICIK